MTPALGALSASGLYTAPTGITAPATTTIKATSVADSTALSSIAITVLPPGPIRIAVGDATAAPGAPNAQAPDYGPDTNGNMWWRSQAGQLGAFSQVDDGFGSDYPPLPNTSLYETSRYSLDDMIYRFAVSNGNYWVKLMFARPGCSSSAQFDPNGVSPIKLEAQAQIVADNWHWGNHVTPINECRMPTSVLLPAQVVNNDLYFALRRVTAANATPVPLLNAFEIDSDPVTTPTIAIDTTHLPANQQAPAGTTVQFSAYGVFMSNSVNWSATGVGYIDQAGLYTAPANAPSSAQTVTVTATSSANPDVTASATFTVPGGS